MTQEVKEGLADMADIAERDHEVQMARAELYKIAKYSIALHDMLKGVSEAEGLEGWVQSKITKAADMIGSVYHHLDYDQVQDKLGESVNCNCGPSCACKGDCDSNCNCGPACNESVEEGKSPHKKGTKKYKKHMAAMHAESVNDPYKSSLRYKLAEKKRLTKEA